MNFKLRNLVVASLASTVLMGVGSNAMADTTDDIVNALMAKGVLTEEEGALLMKGREGEVAGQKKKESKAWSNKISIRGYLQTRNTQMIGGEDVGVNLFSDRSVGNDRSLGDQDKNFLIRRARVVISGDVGERLGIYIQPDFASSATGGNNLGQLRDFYGDFYLSKDKVHRVRVGQSKVPYGFENLQSSQNRLALDRADALNSAVKDERDLGAFYYYTPEATQALFKEITDLGLKHSGNYGQFAFGAYNGQGANQRETNDNYHMVARYTHPWKTDTGQIYEAGIQAYSGDYTPVTTSTYRRRNPTTGVIGTAAVPTLAERNGFDDERVALSFMMYPQPFGLQGEWNWGKTPGLDQATGVIQEQKLDGGYVQAMYKIDHVKVGETDGTLIPFVRWQYFDGFQKAETNAPQNKVNDWEIGAEWQIAPEVELVAYLHHMNRTNVVTGAGSGVQDYAKFKADAIRVQLQYNF